MENKSSTNKNRHCFYPKCTSGYQSNKQKLSVFSAPRDKNLFEKWRDIIPRKDRVFTQRDVVCEKHFYKDEVIRTWTSGDIIIPLKKFRLKEGAIPSSKLDDRRLEYRNPVVKKRQLIRNQLPIIESTTIKAKKIEQYHRVTQETIEEMFVDMFEEIIYKRHSLILPEGWATHILPETILIAECKQDNTNPYLARSIAIDKKLNYNLYYLNNPMEKNLVPDLSNLEIKKFCDVERLVNIYKNTYFCVGGPTEKAFPSGQINSRVAYIDSLRHWRHKMCRIISEPKSSCTYCNSLHSSFFSYQAKKLMRAKMNRSESRKLNRYKEENEKLRNIIKELKHKLDDIPDVMTIKN